MMQLFGLLALIGLCLTHNHTDLTHIDATASGTAHDHAHGATHTGMSTAANAHDHDHNDDNTHDHDHEHGTQDHTHANDHDGHNHDHGTGAAPMGTLTEGAPAAVDMLCTAMPFMTACGLRSLCSDAGVNSGPLCAPVAQLKYTCVHDEGMENMKGCDFWKEKCSGGTKDEV